MEIRLYEKGRDEEKLMRMMEEEGEEWADYWGLEGAAKFKLALQQSITHVAYEGGELGGFTRSLDDCGFNILVMDLLVSQPYRGQNIGRKLIDRICKDYPEHEMYVLSDNDGYYERQGYPKVGTVYRLNGQ